MDVDQEAVVRARVRTLRLMRVAAWTNLISAAVVVGLVGMGAAIAYSTPLLILLFPAVTLAFSGNYVLWSIGRTRRTWETTGISPLAFRMSPAGLRCSIDAAPDSIFLPWNAVVGFRLRRWRGGPRLILDLMPGVTPTTPGVQGLEHPDVQRILHKKVHGTKGLRYAISTLRQPVAAIDQALASFSGGRVRVR